MRGIDVSVWNAPVDWQKVKAAGIEFAVCRSGYGTKEDEAFQGNVEGAHSAGLICGAYHYSYALTKKQAVQEAEICKKIIDNAGVLLELPVFFDMEDADYWKYRHNFLFSKRNITELCKAFLEHIKPLNAGVYASYSWLEDYIDWRSLNCPIWSAQWGKKDFFKGFMWQYTDSLKIGGAEFDGNILYDNVAVNKN